MRFRLHPTVCRLGSNRHVNCIECHWWWWRDDMFPHQFRIPVPVLFINLFNSSASDFTIFKRISAGLYDSVSVSLAKVPCKVFDWLCKLPGDYVPADKWGLFSLFYLWWHMELDWNRIESLCLVLQKFIPIRIGNLWKLFCGQLQPLKTLVIWWWECFVSVTCSNSQIVVGLNAINYSATAAIKPIHAIPLPIAHL